MTASVVVADLFDALTVLPSADVAAAAEAHQLELPRAELDALTELARRLNLSIDMLWVAGWALLLARIAGASAARIASERGSHDLAVPESGPLDAWLRECAASWDSTSTSTTAASAWSTSGSVAMPSEHEPALAWRALGDGALARFAPSKIDRGNVARLGELLRGVMLQLAAHATTNTTLAELSPLSAAEREQVLRTWNQTDVRYRPEATVHGLFREQAAADPDRWALLWDGGRLSYRELDQASDALAERLIASGVATDAPVALCLEAPRR
jgi:AMP-binding enzyme